MNDELLDEKTEELAVEEIETILNGTESNDTDEGALDDYEQEAERLARRMERRVRMQKSKQRQLLIRKVCRIAIPAVVVLVGIIVATVIFLNKKNNDGNDNGRNGLQSFADGTEGAGNAKESEDENKETAGADTLNSETDGINGNSSEEGSTPNGGHDGTGESNTQFVDSKYGPFANVYSEEKDLFFEGYEIADNPNAAVPGEEEVYSTYALLLNAETGEILVDKSSNTRINPASMTKIMTVLVAAERVNNLDDTFLIDASINEFVYKNDCSAVYFATDEVVTVRDLMYGTILPSGADAAMALAEYVGGSEELFVDMMNEKLEELGLSDTAHFTNCVGIYDENHYCTLRDMAMIMKAAVENDLARQILSEHTYTTSKTPEHEDGLTISNWFLRRIEDKETNGEVICAKTGFVNESGCCAASYEVSDSGGRYICVTADTWSSWRCIYDHVELYADYVR